MDVREGFVIIHGVEGYESYQWEFLAALYNPETKAYYLYKDGGCSCNYPFEDNYWDAGAPMNKGELLGEIRSLRTDSGAYLKLEDYLELEESVKWFNPGMIDMEEFDRLRY